MFSKGIAIRTILLILIGVVVLAVMVYLVYGTTTESPLSSTACMGKVIEWCTRCKLKGKTAWEAGNCDSDGSNPNLCPCLSTNPEWNQWVSKCVDDPSLKDLAHWNFDPTTLVGSYDHRPDENCPKVGVN
jgi:hypothetical protein